MQRTSNNRNMIIPFDLEKAKAGAKVVTRNGKSVDLFIRQSDLREDYPLQGIINDDSGDDMFRSWTIDGKSFIGKTHSIDDLFIEVEDEEIKEDEGEKIRKGLLSHLRELREWKVGTMSPIKTPEHYEVWITWLENKKY